MNHFKNLLLNLSLIPRTAREIRNPSMMLRDYLGWVRDDYVVEMRDGVRVQVRHGTTDKGVVKEVFLLDHYKFALPHLKPGSVVVDVGAQIGVFSVYVSCRGPKGLKIHSFEPMGANYALLKQNLGLNRLDNVTAHNAAVTAESGKFKLYLSDENTGMHSLYGESENFEEVEGHGFNDLYDSLKIDRCDVLKLDCEGAEYDILRVAKPEVLERTGAIIMEYHDEKRLPELVKRLEDAKFSVEVFKDHPMLCARR